MKASYDTAMTTQQKNNSTYSEALHFKNKAKINDCLALRVSCEKSKIRFTARL